MTFPVTGTVFTTVSVSRLHALVAALCIAVLPARAADNAWYASTRNPAASANCA